MSDNTFQQLEQIQKNAKKYVIRGDQNKRDFDSSKIKNEFAYGSCYGNEIAFDANSGAVVQNTWYEISDADMTDGRLNLVTHDGSGKLTAGVAGDYLCNYSVSGEGSTGAGTHIQTTFSVSGTETNDGMNHTETSGANAQIGLSGTAILNIPSGGTLEVSIRCTDATPTITVDHLNITIMKLGKDLQGMGSFITTQASDLKKQKIMK